MRDHSSHIELPRELAIERLVNAARFEPAIETVDLHEAHMRVTARECRSLINVPNALCAQMDGIAVRFDDFANGMPDTSNWQLGREYDWANTGTALPQGFDCSIAIEQVEFDSGVGAVSVNGTNPGVLRILEAPTKRFANCRETGASFEAGCVLLPAGTRLTPTKLSALAMCGYASIDVVKRPRVSFIPTGDELVSPGDALPIGKAYDSNGILLEGKLLLWGAEPIVRKCIPDDWSTIKSAILNACNESDIVVVNAGSSKGAKDFTMEILEEIGSVICHETNHGPGRHTSASIVNGTPVLGLSGPPSGCEITADWYLKPLVDAFLYGHTIEFDHVKAHLGKAEKAAGTHKMGAHSAFKNGPAKSGGPGKDFFAIRPVKLERSDNSLKATPITGGPHPDLLKLDEADGYLEMHPSAYRELSLGDEVVVELRYPYTSL